MENSTFTFWKGLVAISRYCLKLSRHCSQCVIGLWKYSGMNLFKDRRTLIITLNPKYGREIVPRVYLNESMLSTRSEWVPKTEQFNLRFLGLLSGLKHISKRRKWKQPWIPKYQRGKRNAFWKHISSTFTLDLSTLWMRDMIS